MQKNESLVELCNVLSQAHESGKDKPKKKQWGGLKVSHIVELPTEFGYQLFRQYLDNVIARNNFPDMRPLGSVESKSDEYELTSTKESGIIISAYGYPYHVEHKIVRVVGGLTTIFDLRFRKQLSGKNGLMQHVRSAESKLDPVVEAIGRDVGYVFISYPSHEAF